MGRFGIDDVEDLSGVTLLPQDREELLNNHTEATFCFARPGGWATAVVMSFVRHNGDFWFTTTNERVQATALSADPRVTVSVSSLGTGTAGRQCLITRGIAKVYSDRETLDEMLLVIASRLQPADPALFVKLLDSPKRVVIRVIPITVGSSHDSRRMPGDGRGGEKKP